MPQARALFQSADFQHWLEQIRTGTIPPVARGNQGCLWRYQAADWDLAVKRCSGGWLTRSLHRRNLHREHRAYQRLQGLQGIAPCLGMPDRDTLVLGYISGTPYRYTEFTDRTAWFEALEGTVQTMHQQGVGHGDLKRKENLLAGDDGRPYVLDFGTAWLRRPGRHPLNHWLFRFCCRLDINAVIKHKYHGRYDQVSGVDLTRLRPTWPERLWRWLRPVLGIK